jgi:hypothetical protein
VPNDKDFLSRWAATKSRLNSTPSGLTRGSTGRASVGFASFRAPVGHNVRRTVETMMRQDSVSRLVLIGCVPAVLAAASTV